MNKKESASSSQIIFSSLVKRLSRRLRMWQQRILTLNSRGEIYITRVAKKSPGLVLVASSSQQTRNKQKGPVFNITEHGALASQGKRSDAGWPAKLDLRQSLVLSSASKTYVFLPSVRAAESLKTHLRILEMRQESEEKSDTDTESLSGSELDDGEAGLRRGVSESIHSLPEADTSQSDGRSCEMITKEEKEAGLTLLTGLDRQKSFSLVSLVEFTDIIKASLLQQSDTLTEENDGDLTNKQNDSPGKNAKEGKTEERKEVDPFEMCLDFTSGPGYLACNRNSIVRDSSFISMQKLSRRDSLLFKPSTHFRPKPILKQRSLYAGEKRESETRVRFNTCPSVRIISNFDKDNVENIEGDHDLVSHYIYKYVVNSHKLKSDRFNDTRKKQA